MFLQTNFLFLELQEIMSWLRLHTIMGDGGGLQPMETWSSVDKDNWLPIFRCVCNFTFASLQFQVLDIFAGST